MNTPPEALPEIDIGEFRQRYPQLFSDPGVDVIYCGPGWKNLLLALCDTLRDHLARHPEVVPVTLAQVKSKFGELHFSTMAGMPTAEVRWMLRPSYR